MISVINGKKYNTKTSELVARGNNGLPLNDCWCRTEELYRSKKGNYFIVNMHYEIIPVNKIGEMELPELLDCCDYSNFTEWLKEWNISELAKRETNYFSMF